MTPDDFRSIVREEIASAKAEPIARQDSAVEAIAGEISALREEFSRRMETIEERLNNFAVTLFAIDQRTSAQARSIDKLLDNHQRDAGTLAALGRQFEQTSLRLKAFEDKALGNQSPQH